MIARWLAYLVQSVLVLKEDQGNDSDNSCEDRRRLDRGIQMLCLSEMSDPATTNWKYRLYGWANAFYSDTKRSGTCMRSLSIAASAAFSHLLTTLIPRLTLCCFEQPAPSLVRAQSSLALLFEAEDDLGVLTITLVD